MVDFAVQKSIPVRQEKRLTFRMEATNRFDRVQLGLSATSLCAAEFRGRSQCAIGLRIPRAARFDF